MISVVNVRHYSGNYHYVGRPSPLGNPYRMGIHGSRSVVVSKYRLYLWNSIKYSDPLVLSELHKLHQISINSDLNLGCYCYPLPCHADVIKSCLHWIIDENINLYDNSVFVK